MSRIYSDKIVWMTRMWMCILRKTVHVYKDKV